MSETLRRRYSRVNQEPFIHPRPIGELILPSVIQINGGGKKPEIPSPDALYKELAPNISGYNIPIQDEPIPLKIYPENIIAIGENEASQLRPDEIFMLNILAITRSQPVSKQEIYQFGFRFDKRQILTAKSTSFSIAIRQLGERVDEEQQIINVTKNSNFFYYQLSDNLNFVDERMNYQTPPVGSLKRRVRSNPSEVPEESGIIIPKVVEMPDDYAMLSSNELTENECQTQKYSFEESLPDLHDSIQEIIRVFNRLPNITNTLLFSIAEVYSRLHQLSQDLRPETPVPMIAKFSNFLDILLDKIIDKHDDMITSIAKKHYIHAHQTDIETVKNRARNEFKKALQTFELQNGESKVLILCQYSAEKAVVDFLNQRREEIIETLPSKS